MESVYFGTPHKPSTGSTLVGSWTADSELAWTSLVLHGFALNITIAILKSILKIDYVVLPFKDWLDNISLNRFYLPRFQSWLHLKLCVSKSPLQ